MVEGDQGGIVDLARAVARELADPVSGLAVEGGVDPVGVVDEQLQADGQVAQVEPMSLGGLDRPQIGAGRS
jgi:hypothetical protein